MKLLVLSDIHGNTRAMMRAVDAHNDADAVFFLGDGLRDAEEINEVYPRMRVYRVRGNGDYACFDPLDGLTAFGGLAVYYTHGHLFGVKSGLEALAGAAASRGADLALFGHTHRPCKEILCGVTLFNPGAVASGSCGIIRLGPGAPEFSWESV